MPVVNPTFAANFLVTMWDCQGPGFFGIDAAGVGGWGVASRIASGLVAAGSQFLFGAFASVDGLTAELTFEGDTGVTVGGENTSQRAFVKSGKHPELVLSRGVTFNTDLWDWHQQVLHGKDPMIRKSGIVLLLDRASVAGGDLPPEPKPGDKDPLPQRGGVDVIEQLAHPPVAAWFFERGLPKALKGPKLLATNAIVAMETLEIRHEGLVRVSLAAIPGLADAAAGVGGLISAAAAGAAAGTSAGIFAIAKAVR